MSNITSKVMSPTDNLKHDSILAKTPSETNSVRPSLPVTTYNICHMKSPMVHCVKLNIPNGNTLKTDVERDNKTDTCNKKSESLLRVGNDSENAALPSCNIKNEDLNGDMDTAEDHTALAPDSTSHLENKQIFNCGDEVFVQQKDGRYYLGTVIKAETDGDRWLVRFGDNTERWAAPSELRPLSSPGGADAPAMCVVCKQSTKDRSNEVISCDKCSRGYHPSCHSPPVSTRIKGIIWNCKRCEEQQFKVNRAAVNRIHRKSELVNIEHSQKILPYDLKSLHWDELHRRNTENTYCYCGEAGEWFTQMLQCMRCRQWFHQNCIISLKYPIYTGDRFYIFICSICNFGSEFLRRIEMKWVDLVHLVLFNLTVFHSKKYFDLDTIIIPYTTNNWEAMQLPAKMSLTSPTERREQILSALGNNDNRFKCGREMKKRTTIWGLRKRTPPPPPVAPNTSLPRGPISDHTLAHKWNRLGFTFVPSPKDKRYELNDFHQRMIVPADSHWQFLMMGKQFQSNSSSDVESNRSTPSPMQLLDGYSSSNDYSKKRYSSKKYGDDGEESDYNSNDDIPLTDIKMKRKEFKMYEMNYQGGGFVKKSVPFPKSPISKRRKSEMKSHSKKRSKKWRNEFRDSEKLDDDEVLHKNKKKLRKSLAREEKLRAKTKGMNILITRDDRLLDNDLKDGTYISTKVESKDGLPPTPPTSMSTPSTPPATSTNLYDSLGDISSNYHQITKKEECNYDSEVDLADFKDKRMKLKEKSPKKAEKLYDEADKRIQITRSFKLSTMNLEISKLSTENIIEHSKIMSLHHMKDERFSIYSSSNKIENDSSDDTSSRGTLDSIIPPPVNFRGANNPFHDSDRGNAGNNYLTNKLFNRTNQSKSAVKKCQRISLPVALNPVIQPSVKLMKRKLSEKDLIIGPNGEVKRRRLRRPKNLINAQVNLGNKHTSERHKLRSSHEELSKNQSVRTDSNVKSRCLRQRQERNYCDSRRGSTSSNNGITTLARISNSSSSSIQSMSNTNPNISSIRGLNLSPQKNQNDQWNDHDNIHDLKLSVRSYFGATNRIAAGEKFSLVGRRLTENGELQYLIEWEGHGS